MSCARQADQVANGECHAEFASRILFGPRGNVMQSYRRVLVIIPNSRQRQMVRRAIQGLCDGNSPRSHQETEDALQEYAQLLATETMLYAVIILDVMLSAWLPKGAPRSGSEVLSIFRPDPAATEPSVILWM